ncbi:hypothetical protein [Paraburkholderia phenoliruptrix]|uniref:hypothetical protein n=1 Tax=Paraburkholderia phenoliruptrix TaxID=252970 RepID=UPI0034CE37A9
MSKSLSTKAQRELGNWLINGNVGVSSKTMAAIALGATTTSAGEHGWGVDAPHDPADFGRCYRLVQKVPEIREFFPRIAKKVKPFAGILKHWDELVRLYERDKPTGKSDELYNRIKQLRGDKS